MHPGQAWAILGIAPTDERKAIRKAYAAKLKAIDPDADIAGFQQLRAALEAAEWQAKQGRLYASADGASESVPSDEDEDAPEQAAQQHDEPPPEPVGEPTAPANVTVRIEPPAPPAPVDPMMQVANRLETLVRKRAINPVEIDELVALFETLVADERIDAIDFAERFENWLTSVLLNGGPGADAIIPLAVEKFGWRVELESLNPRHAQLAIARRGEDLRCVAALASPDHHWHEAYTVLMAPEAPRLNASARVRLAPQISELMESLYLHNPGVLDALNRDRFHEWQTYLANRNQNRDVLFKPAAISWWTAMIAIWFVVAVFRFASQPAVPDPLLEPVAVEVAHPAPAPTPVPATFIPAPAYVPPSVRRLELEECLGPDAPKRSSDGQLDCAALRQARGLRP